MTEREALIAIRDRTSTISEAIAIARRALKDGQTAREEADLGPDLGGSPLDLSEPISVQPGVTCTCRRKTIQPEQHAPDCPVYLGRHG